MVGVGVEHPHAARARHPDVALLVALHAVGHAGHVVVGQAVDEHVATVEGAVGVHAVDPHQRVGGVVDVQQRLVGREAEAVGLVEGVLVNAELRGAVGTGRYPEHALPAQLAGPLHAEARHAAVPRVGEVDRAVGPDNHIVGAVQLHSLEVRGHRLAAAVGALAHHLGGGVLAHDQVQVGVVGHAVALVGRPQRLGHLPVLPAAAHVAGHVGEQQVVVPGMPDRALGEGEAAADHLDRGIPVNEPPESVVVGAQGHCSASC